MSYFRERMKVISQPAIITMTGNVRLAVGGPNGWVPMYPGETLDEMFDWGQEDQQEKLEQPQQLKPVYLEIVSENSGETYTITIMNERVSCNCKGYSFRKKCSHSDKVKKMMGYK